MFLSGLGLLADSSPDIWIVSTPLVWCDPVFGRIEVPVGFRTDLASIPRLFRNLPFLDPNGRSRRPAVVHDWLYAVQTTPKARADDFLYASLLAEGEGHGAALCFYWAVHAFGRWSWQGDAGKAPGSLFDTLAHYRAYQLATGRR